MCYVMTRLSQPSLRIITIETLARLLVPIPDWYQGGKTHIKPDKTTMYI